jgi:preprotein translocase subunit YajC
MNLFFLFLLQAQAETSQMNIMSFLPFILIIGIFYFLIIRPQSKKRKDTERMISALKKGDKIVTIGGLYGTIQNLKESTVILKIDDNVKVEFLRSAISSVITPSREKEEKIEDKSDDNDESSEAGE